MHSCVTSRGMQPAIKRYCLRQLYALRTRSGRLRPNHPAFARLAEHGLLHYRGCRAGRRSRRPIRTIGRPVSEWDMCRSDRPALTRGPQTSAVRSRNINNLVYPVIARHAVQPSRSISCGSLNVCSARNKIEGIDSLMRDRRLDILSLCETWHEDSDCITIGRLRELKYNVIEKARPAAPDADKDNVHYVNHGGVALLSTATIRLTQLTITGDFKSFEFVCVRVASKGVPAIVLTIYRPGSLPPDAVFFNEFATVLERLALMSGTIVITGDINIRVDRPTDPHAQQLKELLDSYGFEQLVTQPTHRAGGLLDVVIVREGYKGHVPEVCDVGLSDHSCVLWSLDVTRPAPVYCRVEYRDWKSFDLDTFKDDISQSALCCGVIDPSDSTTAMTDRYNATLSVLFDRHVAVKSMVARERNSNNEWFDEECRTAKICVRALERKFQSSQNRLDRDVWTTSLRSLHSLFNSKKASFTVRLVEAESGDPARLWRTLNSTLGLSSPDPDIPHTAEEFSAFFANKVARIRDLTANAPPPTFHTAPPSTLITFTNVTEESVIDIIMKSPCKHSQVDPIPTWLLKQCVSLLSQFLTRLINSSMMSCEVPECMKMAFVTPLLKKSNLDPTDISNYRPVSNLSFLSKLLERTISHQITGYLESASLLSRHQSAYRANHSTETAIVRIFSDIVSEADAGNISLMALLDLSAAFDTVDYDILFCRLERDFGISGTALAWIRSYLSERRQAVRCGSSLSATTHLTCGVPQGSVLGPLLFLIYTTGLDDVIARHGMKNHAYADDGQIYGSCKPGDTVALRAIMLSCIDDVNAWMASNRLKLNPAKTEFLWCSTPRMTHHVDYITPFVIDGVAIAPVRTVKLLGVHLDSELSMTAHVSRTVSTCFYQLRRLKTVRRSLPMAAAKTVVSAFVASRVDYCNGVLAGVTQRQVDRMQSILNAAARLLYGGAKRDHITPLIRDKLHWLKFKQRVTYKLCVLVYKSLHNCAPKYLGELVVPVANNSGQRRLRSADSGNIVRPRSRLKFGDRGFALAAPEAWNSLPQHIKAATSLSCFTESLKTELFKRSYS